MAALAILDGKSLEAQLRSPYEYSARFSGRAVTLAGIMTSLSRFVPKSHEGFSNEAYVDKEWILGYKRVAFTARKLKASQRRAHIRLMREHLSANRSLTGNADAKGKFETSGKEIATGKQQSWTCELPDKLCLRCPNCTLYGGLRPGSQFALLSRARFQDSFSFEPTVACVANDESNTGDMGIDGMGIGNTQFETLTSTRSSSSFFYYEYVRPGTHFPFVLTILDPDVLDVSGTLAAMALADSTGYGSYASNQGKFQTTVLAMALGLPRFSALDMITWSGCDDPEQARKRLGDTAYYRQRLVEKLRDPGRWLARGLQVAEDDDLLRRGAAQFEEQLGSLDLKKSSAAVLSAFTKAVSEGDGQS